jgi:hypothetical protein
VTCASERSAPSAHERGTPGEQASPFPRPDPFPLFTPLSNRPPPARHRDEGLLPPTDPLCQLTEAAERAVGRKGFSASSTGGAEPPTTVHEEQDQGCPSTSEDDLSSSEGTRAWQENPPPAPEVALEDEEQARTSRWILVSVCEGQFSL